MAGQSFQTYTAREQKRLEKEKEKLRKQAAEAERKEWDKSKLDVYLNGVRYNLKDGFPIEAPKIDDLYRKFYNIGSEFSYSRRDYDNDVPMPFRVPDMNEMRIGDCKFTVPPLSISVTTSSNVQSVIGLRQANSIKKNNGYSTRTIHIPLWFNGLDDINGYRVKSPFSDPALSLSLAATGNAWWSNRVGNTRQPDMEYYIDGFRSLLAQFKRTPFLPIRNELLNLEYGIWNVSLITMNVSTVPDFPYCLQVELVLREFNVDPYIENISYSFHDMFDWDVFRWYYQQLIIDSPERDSIVYFEPVKKNIHSDTIGKEISIQILNSEIIDRLLESGIKPSSLHDYYEDILTLFNDEEDNIKEGVLPAIDMQIQYIAVSLMNIIPDIQMSNYNMPTSQFIGAGDIVFNLNAVTTNQAVASAITIIKQIIDDNAKKYKAQYFVGFCKIVNDIFQLFGVNYVFIETINIDTVPDFPNVYTIAMKLISYEPTQRFKEGLYAFNPFTVKDGDQDVLNPDTSEQVIWKTYMGIQTKARQDCYAEQKLLNVNLYQDLELPSYKTFDKVLKAINAFRAANKIYGGLRETRAANGACYVDPDFYIGYSILDTSGFEKLPEAESVLQLFKFPEKDLNIRYEKEKRKQTVSPLFLKALGADCIIQSPSEYLTSTERPLPVFQFVAERMCHDMIKYGKRGKLNRAFPTYLISFIDEGPSWLDGRKMWGNYYITTSALEIEVHQSREYPNHTATILLSNTFNNLYNTNWKDQLVNPDYYKKFDFGSPNLDRKMLENHMVLLESVKLEDGVRVHIRIGYGNNAALLPTVFNGYITQINTDIVMQIVCQSDGMELINNIFTEDKEDAHTGTFKYGREPANVIGHVMTAISNKWSNLIESAWGENSKFGIEHFGIASGVTKATRTDRQRDSDQDVMNRNLIFAQMEWYKEYDVIKNIYHANNGEVKSLSENWRNSNEIFGFELPDSQNSNQWLSAIFPPADIIQFFMINKDGADKNLCVYLNNKTPWDVFQETTSVIPDFICYPHYHHFESRIFFGSPFWNVKYKHSLGKVTPDILDQDLYFQFGTAPEKLFFTDREPQIGKTYKNNNSNMHVFEHVKPFSQFHILTSGTSIIDNQIVASADAIKATACICSYVQGSTVKMGSVVYADNTINPSLQKTRNIDSSVYTNIPLVSGVIEDGVRYVGGALTGQTPTEDNIRQMSTRYLQNSLSMMYQNPIIVLGAAEIKPHDVIYIVDNFADVIGLAEVRQVIHTLNIQGFATSIYVDLCTFQAINETGKSTVYANLLKIAGAFSALESFKTNVEYAGALDSLNDYYDKFIVKYNHLIRDASQMAITGYNAFIVSKSIFVSIKFGRWAKLWGNVKNAGTNVVQAIKVFKTAKSLKGALNTIKSGGGIFAGTGIGLVAGIVLFAVGIALDLLLDGVIDYLMDRNAIKIIPLTLRGKDYVAGVSGQKRLMLQPLKEDEGAASKVKNVRYEAIKNYLPETYKKAVEYQLKNRGAIDKFYANYNSFIYKKIFTVMRESEHYINVKEVDPTAMAQEELRLVDGKRIMVLNTPGGEYKLADYAIYSMAGHSRFVVNHYESDNEDGQGRLGDPVYAMMAGECVCTGGSFRAANMVNDSELIEHNFSEFNDLANLGYSMERFLELFQALEEEPPANAQWLKNFIILQHFDTDKNMMFFSFYINMLTVEIRPEDCVAAGQLIGTAGVLITKATQAVYETVASDDTYRKLKKAVCYYLGVNKYITEREILDRSIITSNNILEIAEKSVWSWLEPKPPTRTATIVPEIIAEMPYTVVGGSALQVVPAAVPDIVRPSSEPELPEEDTGPNAWWSNRGQGGVSLTSANERIERVQVTLAQALDQQSKARAVRFNDFNSYASRAEIEEYLRPERFASDPIQKYQFADLRTSVGVSENEMKTFLSGRGKLSGKEIIFLNAAKKYNICEAYLAAHASLETGNGTSPLATGIKVNGVTVYNMYGIGAKDSDPEGLGSKFAASQGWTSVDKAIEGGAKWISENYINKGAGQNTIYKMRWNPMSPATNQYATDVGWAYKQAPQIKKIFDTMPGVKPNFVITQYA